MRATIWALPVTFSLLVIAFAPAPASADFHPVCEPEMSAYANVELLADRTEAGWFDYHGRVYCPGSIVEIHTLQLFDTSGAQDVLLSEVSGGPCASHLTSETCVVRGSHPADAGPYEVRMLFNVSDPETGETEFVDVPRHASFLYAGAGQPVPTCMSVGFIPLYAPPGC